MICEKCGKEIKGNRLFCPSCGTEVQIVPEYTQLEDEIMGNMELLKETTQDVKKQTSKEQPGRKSNSLNRDLVQGAQSLQIPNYAGAKSGENEEKKSDFSKEKERNVWAEDEDDWGEFRLEKKKDTVSQRRLKLISSIVALSVAIVLVVTGIIIYVISSANESSYSSQIKKGDEYWKQGDYSSAAAAFKNAIEGASDNREKGEACCKLASVFVEQGNAENAIKYYETAVACNEITTEDISTLVGLYENKDDNMSIRKLAEKFNNKETKELFQRHLLNQPEFSYKSGTYNELLTVELTVPNGEKIYYTLDNKPATEQSVPYEEALQIGEGTTVVRAISVNAEGLVSDEVITTYEVKLDVPPSPVISPDTGKYAEATKISIHNIPTNCKAYYTTDGSVPDKKSKEYEKPFDMMLGNYVIMAVCINEYTGQSSPVSVKIYDLSVNGKITWAEAAGKVMTRLQELDVVSDNNGNMKDGKVCTLLPFTISEIGGKDYYIVKRYQKESSELKEEGSIYAVDINTGGVFKARDNGNGEYNLSGL